MDPLTAQITIRLQVSEHVCQQGDLDLFDPVSWQQQSGQMVQVSGPNGVGKSTLLRGLVFAHCDSIQWQQQSADRQWECIDDLQKKQWIGFIEHTSGLSPALSVLDNLDYLQGLSGFQGPASHRLAALSAVGLQGYEQQKVSQLSAGQTRRVALARLWLEPRRVWILDEPLTSLDAQGVQLLANRIQMLAQSGVMIIFTTHQPIPELKAQLVPLRESSWAY